MKRNTKDNIFVFVLASISMVLISNVSAIQADGENKKVALQPNTESSYYSNKTPELTEIQKITLRNSTKQSASNSKDDSSSLQWEDYNINFW